MPARTIDRDVLGEVWCGSFAKLQAGLGEGFEHLKCSRKPERHGTRTSVFINRIYDDRQSEATLPWKFCAYALNYDPDEFETSGHNWCLKLHINTERLYFPRRDEVVKLLSEGMPRACPAGFDWRPHPRQLVIERQFTHKGSERDVCASIQDWVKELIESTYPLFEKAILIAEGSALEKANRRAFAALRARTHAPAANPESVVDRRALNRSIPPALRAEVIRLNRDGRCRICGRPCPPDEIHIDHIVSVASGGLTVLSNLQVTCEACNLAKGSGRPRSEVAHIPAKNRPRTVRDYSP